MKAQSQKDYEEFFRRNPEQKNPTDLNTPEKWAFATYIGYERYTAMQSARKAARSYTKNPN